jgi:predicted MFS family arabinose efflux permease
MKNTSRLSGNPLFYLISIATGVSVSCIYLSQPLLQTLGTHFGTSTGNIGLVASFTQIGYALGLFFLIPMGDILSKKKLIITKQILLVISLLFAAISTHWIALLIASTFIGLLATVAQDFVSFSADLAEEKSRGKVIGLVMSGLFMGILCSRTLSGIIADFGGWRSVFVIFSIATILLSIIVIFKVPTIHPSHEVKPTYRELLISLVHQFNSREKLRTSLFTQGLLGFGFSAFWTNLSFHLGGPTFNLSTTQIGLFGIAGAAGVLIAPIAGKKVDTQGPYKGITSGALLVIASFLAMWAWPSSLIIIILGTVTFDLGLQAALVSHQAIIFSLDAQARSRINAIFMTGLFTFFALGSFISVKLQQNFGWRAVLMSGIITSCVALVLAKRAAKKNEN